MPGQHGVRLDDHELLGQLAQAAAPRPVPGAYIHHGTAARHPGRGQPQFGFDPGIDGPHKSAEYTFWQQPGNYRPDRNKDPAQIPPLHEMNTSVRYLSEIG